MQKKTSRKLKIKRSSIKKGGKPSINEGNPRTFIIYGEGLDNTEIDANGYMCTKITGLTTNNSVADLYTAIRNRRPRTPGPAGDAAFLEYQRWPFQLTMNSYMGLPVNENRETLLNLNIPDILFLLNATKDEVEYQRNNQNSN